MRNVIAALALFLIAGAAGAQEVFERTINYANSYLTVYFEPLKANGTTIGALDNQDFPVTWTVNGNDLPTGMTVIGIAKVHTALGATLLDFHGETAGGGTQTYQVSVRGDADLDPGQIRLVTWDLTLVLTVVADEAVTGAGRVVVIVTG